LPFLTTEQVTAETYTSEALALLYGLDTETITRWSKCGLKRTGRLFHQADVKDFIEDNERKRAQIRVAQ
jgi:hypothetical protein